MANVFMKEFPVIVLKKRVIIVISLCVTMILLFLQPFSFGVYRHYAIFPALGYGGVTFISMHVFNSMIKKLSLKWISHWIVLYEIGFIFALLLFIATLKLSVYCVYWCYYLKRRCLSFMVKDYALCRPLPHIHCNYVCSTQIEDRQI